MPMLLNKTPQEFGFKFWLGWIVQFAGSFVLAVIFWTAGITALFGQIEGIELTLTWGVAVFGSWFLLMIPLMRKKEQIWKRLNQDQEKAVSAWLLGMGIFIGMLIASALGWSIIFRDSLGQNKEGGLNLDWVKAVIGTWLFLLLPFLVFMYRKADAIFKSAEERQIPKGPLFQSTFVEKSKRMIPETLRRKIEAVPPILGKGHIAHLRLRDGSNVSHAFILNASEILGLYDRKDFDFNVQDIEDVELIDQDHLVAYEEAKWLRLDGRA